MSFRSPSIRGFGLCLLVAMLIAGCSSGPPARTNFDAAENTTTYETDSILLPSIQWGSGYGGQKTAEVFAKAQCYGRGCTPSSVYLVFRVSGGGTLELSQGGVTLKADGKSLYAPGQKRAQRNRDEMVSAVGVVATARLSYATFRTLARATRCSGRLGGSSFTLDHEDRAPFRMLLQQIEGTTS